MRALLLAMVALATPATAQSALSPAEIGTLFCNAIVSGDVATLDPLLTADLAALSEGREVRWHTGDAMPSRCMPVGASGTAERPEAVLFLTYPDGRTASDRLVLTFVDGQLRIDDVAYDRNAGTLRGSVSD